MSAGAALTPPSHDASTAKKTLGFPSKQPKRAFHPILTQAVASSAQRSTTDYSHDADSTDSRAGDAEDEYTLCAYGDLSFSEVIVPAPPAPTHSGSPISLQSKFQPRLRLKMRRPPMPKRRPSYIYMPDPLPYMGGTEPDVNWPGSPRHSNPPWLQHQSLVSPVSATPPPPRMRENDLFENGGSSVEKLFDELLLRSPSIRLSPPGPPANRAIGSLPRETSRRHSPKNGVRGRDVLKTGAGANVATKAPRSPSASRQDTPKEAPWRTRLPPRLPIPKWDA